MATTKEELDRSQWDYCSHYNMGKLGWGFGYRCNVEPRAMLIIRNWKDKRDRRAEWYVDGVEVVDLPRTNDFVDVPQAVVDALAKGPTVTEDEQRVLDLVPTEFADLRQTEDDLAGVERPRGGIHPDTPHARVMKWLGILREKGLVELGRREWAADENPNCEFHRWSPTIRRRKAIMGQIVLCKTGDK